MASLASVMLHRKSSGAELNRALLQAQAVPLDDSYKATFGVSITDPRVNQQTENRLLRQDKVVATLMGLAAEAVKSGKHAPDYWQVERRWIAGETAEIMRESLARVQSALPVSS